MMVESREHRLLSFLSLWRGEQHCCCSASSSVFRVACSFWVISYSLSVCGPFGFSFLLLLLVGERGLCFLRQGAHPTTYLSRSSLLIVDQGWGAVYGYIGHILGALWGISGWVGSTLQTRTISG